MTTRARRARASAAMLRAREEVVRAFASERSAGRKYAVHCANARAVASAAEKRKTRQRQQKVPRAQQKSARARGNAAHARRERAPNQV